MKAQMFLLAAIIIVTAIVISLSTFRPTAIEVEKRTLLMRFGKQTADNVGVELENAIEFSYGDAQNMTLNFFDFANFTKKKMAERSIELKLFFLSTLTNITLSEMNVSIINLIGKTINVSVAINTSPSQSNSKILSDYELWNFKFISISSNTTYQLNISYEKERKNLLVKVGEKDIYTAYFDLKLESDDALHRRFFEESYEL